MQKAAWQTTAAALYLAVPTGAVAQDADVPTEPAMIAAEASELVVTTYVLADFARFDPRNALVRRHDHRDRPIDQPQHQRLQLVDGDEQQRQFP